MAEHSIGKITQIIGAVLDIKFADGNLPEINDAIRITRKDGSTLVVEVAQHLGDDTVRCILLHNLFVHKLSYKLPLQLLQNGCR